MLLFERSPLVTAENTHLSRDGENPHLSVADLVRAQQQGSAHIERILVNRTTYGKRMVLDLHRETFHSSSVLRFLGCPPQKQERR